jgi:hypothetical protein
MIFFRREFENLMESFLKYQKRDRCQATSDFSLVFSGTPLLLETRLECISVLALMIAALPVDNPPLLRRLQRERTYGGLYEERVEQVRLRKHLYS